jgi:hypothetical protein
MGWYSVAVVTPQEIQDGLVDGHELGLHALLLVQEFLHPGHLLFMPVQYLAMPPERGVMQKLGTLQKGQAFFVV